MGEQTDTADLVNAVQRLDDAYRIWVAGGSSKVNAAKLLDTWPTIKAALSATQARAEAAEASLAAAKERMALVQWCIGARMGQMTPAQRECAINAAWWLLNDMTGIRPASERPEYVELVRDCFDALKTAGKE